jgi:TIR domain
MPGVFISHSSKDKEFVFKLAIDLLNLGFPVWLDAYELEVGSSLQDRIRGASMATFGSP